MTLHPPCEWCGGPVERRENEASLRFDRRRFCNHYCQLAHVNAKHAAATEPVEPTGRWRIVGDIGESEDGGELSLLVADPAGREVLLLFDLRRQGSRAHPARSPS